MSLEDVLKEAMGFNFNKAERHVVGEVYRTAEKEYRERHPFNANAKDKEARRAYDLNAGFHAEAVARQYVREEVDKWHRRGYRNQADGAQQ